MSERTCFVCELPSEPWRLAGKRYLCERDSQAAARTFMALIGAREWSSDEYGVEVVWEDILSFIERVAVNPLSRTYELTTERRIVEDLRDIDAEVLRVIARGEPSGSRVRGRKPGD